MMKQKQPVRAKPEKDADQLRAFRKAARELGADENEERFKETLRSLATRWSSKTTAIEPGYPHYKPVPGSVVVLKFSEDDSEQWLELTKDGTLIFHFEHAGEKMLRSNGPDARSETISPDEAKRRWPQFRNEIDAALAKLK
jgi:hypothetical protein